MTPEGWAQITEIFAAALEKTAGERAAFLAEACRGDESLRREVESLLAAERMPSIRSPAIKVLGTESSSTGAELSADQVLGRYRVEAKLGEGGMGAVYKAHDTGARGAGGRRIPLISSSRANIVPRYSPDGSRIVFISSRSGPNAVWTCAADGSDPVQLTSFPAPMTGWPNWSPDGQHIVFDSNVEGQYEIYSINRDGGGLRRLTRHPADDALGSWSRDGRWIYFASNRTGDFQVWKMPAQGGEAIQVTRHGGTIPFESPDGKFLYFSKTRMTTSLWKIPVDGGEETKVLDSVFGLTFAVAGRGIYFTSPAVDQGRRILFFSFSTGSITEVASLNTQPREGLSASPDGRHLLYTAADPHSHSDLWLIENFR